VEHRPYFVVGDIATNVLAGALIGGLMAMIFDPGWNMFVAMIVGMALGMALSLPLALLAGAFFGAMEIMLPVMTTGMLAGMVVPMAAAMADHTFADGLWLGVLCGIVVLAATYAANTIIKRKADQWTS